MGYLGHQLDQRVVLVDGLGDEAKVVDIAHCQHASQRQGPLEREERKCSNGDKVVHILNGILPGDGGGGKEAVAQGAAKAQEALVDVAAGLGKAGQHHIEASLAGDGGAVDGGANQLLGEDEAAAVGGQRGRAAPGTHRIQRGVGRGIAGLCHGAGCFQEEEDRTTNLSGTQRHEDTSEEIEERRDRQQVFALAQSKSRGGQMAQERAGRNKQKTKGELSKALVQLHAERGKDVEEEGGGGGVVERAERGGGEV